METIGIPRYGTTTTNVIQINIDENAIAYTQGKVYFQLKYGGSSVIESYEVEVLVGPNVNWTFLDANSDVDSKNSLSFSVQLRNDGNLNDGLIVQLQSSHSTDMGFNLPEGAIVEDGVENPRTFECQIRRSRRRHCRHFPLLQYFQGRRRRCQSERGARLWHSEHRRERIHERFLSRFPFGHAKAPGIGRAHV